jgi:hypothetical protein
MLILNFHKKNTAGKSVLFYWMEISYLIRVNPIFREDAGPWELFYFDRNCPPKALSSDKLSF